MTTTLVPVHGTRLWTEPGFAQASAYIRGRKPRPAVVTVAGIDDDNSTSVSAVRCRR
ncbi:hypothetical protein I4I73_19220 [Pseudonocardia sp. KRD-184]|uniref:Uncharacterized protein n=1 Tax=Pseudonocardia oceani TaxID=2792013 RepID=A0ABS6UC80_9PSEU|nr:hypothetical protein [Pseudonocardia oceani]MBW0091018.1 hypothetical protein [Pseudonocardia oceani]MBW0098117.1 hypothetical protein [Pseudonocardia oceani]MBW0107529.1 hypothetical protein [Pseudonocardia oceani]MBW0120636.1 hypothetical protein [Pseudonocardia oceani]MBW0129847.1 hypothetical protein [Pseudonocardia oceani]